jgi:hypothetical protein
MKRGYVVLALCAALQWQSSHGEERLKLDKTTILGNGELPRVTFVVPWRDAPNNVPDWRLDPAAHPVAVPLDSELYRRQVEYQSQLKERSAAGKPQ